MPMPPNRNLLLRQIARLSLGHLKGYGSAMCKPFRHHATALPAEEEQGLGLDALRQPLSSWSMRSSRFSMISSSPWTIS